MRKTHAVPMALAVFVLLGQSTAAATLEETVRSHVEARGGRKNWDAIRSMKITGSFTAFSEISPFTLHRKRDDRYHLDHMHDHKTVVVGYDGETAWSDNHWIQEGAQAVSGADLAVVLGDVHFATPLFDYESRGYVARFLGSVAVEGQPAVGIELTRPGGAVETWYLDPATHLEIARYAPGSDFGQPQQQRTFYDDFREVQGVVIPYHLETQWYTRDRVMVIENIEFNLTLDDALFRMPAPIGMGPILTLAGTWKVEAARRNQPEAAWQESQRVSTIEPLLKNGMLEERFTTDSGNELIRTLSYDRFKKKYRLTQINDDTSQMDVHEGDFDEEGRLVLSNLATGTSTERFGMTFFGRMSFLEIEEDRFRIEYETSVDAGESWFVAAKASYTRSSVAE